LKKPTLDRRNRSQPPNKGQPTASPNEHTNCKDLKIIYKSGRTNPHWPSTVSERTSLR
jgi:hypothetical protein